MNVGNSKNSVGLRIAETGHPDHLEIWTLTIGRKLRFRLQKAEDL
jgi:hypothetical protein